VIEHHSRNGGAAAHADGRENGSIGERIRLRRHELGLSQRDIAEAGVSFSYISRVEVNARTASVKALRKLAPKLGVSVHWLETGEEDPALELARLVLEHRAALPERAGTLAVTILEAAD
jgi:transcriptional regulator with XRE-family HTH domain